MTWTPWQVDYRGSPRDLQSVMPTSPVHSGPPSPGIREHQGLDAEITLKILDELRGKLRTMPFLIFASVRFSETSVSALRDQHGVLVSLSSTFSSRKGR